MPAQTREEAGASARPTITIPPPLTALTRERRWVVWRWVRNSDGQLTKPPFRADRPDRNASTADPSTWCDCETAMRAYCAKRCDGIGYVLTDGEIAAVDIDDCRDERTGEIHPWALEQIKRAGTYAEVTPSLEGCRLLGLGAGEHLHCKFPVPGTGVVCELFRKATRFITITGQQIEGTANELVNIDVQLDALHKELNGDVGQRARQRRPRYSTRAGKLNERALANLDKWVTKVFPKAKRTRKGGYRVRSSDLGRGFQEDLSLTPSGIKYFGIADQGDPRQGRRSPIDTVMEWEHLDFDAAMQWFEDKLGPEEESRQPDDQPGATKTNGQGASQQDGQEAKASPGPSGQQQSAMLILPAPSAPLVVARCFVESRCLHDGVAGALTVRYWCGSWWTWRTTHWIEAQPHTMRSLLYEFTADAVYFDPKGEVKPWSPSRYTIGDLLEALSSLVILPDDFEQPCWIDGRQTGPIVATSSGLLDVASLQLYPHTPLYFGQVSVPFPYDPDAPAPTKWLNFLDELWPDEPDATDVLGEWFGYVISGRLDLHKIFVMVGPTRGGKGVIARIETALIGKRSVCGPTLNSLGSEFGLQPLLGKTLAIISDARSGGGKNSSVVVERLLSISGEDTLTVNRKYKDQWSGKLPVRLHIISNELPRLGDASSAVVGRLLLLLTTRSWLGKENYELETELRNELPGILNWSLEGLRRLMIDNDNHFTRFAAADEAITTMQDLASPVGAFVRERCKLDAGAEIAVDGLYDAYKEWCGQSEHQKFNKAHFGRDLRAACPSVRKRRPRDGSKRDHVYSCIRLRKDEEELPL